MKTKAASILQRIGGRLLVFFSRCEEKRVLPWFSGWVKVGVLGVFLTAIGWLSARQTVPIATCYDMAIIDPVVVTEATITPNPTKGADTVTVKATAKVYNPGIEGNIITGATVKLASDTLLTPLDAVDGDFSDTLEAVQGRFYIGGLASETTWVDLTFYTSQAGMYTQELMLVVTEPDSSETKD